MRILYLNPSGALGGAERALLEAMAAVREIEPTWTLGLVSFENGPAVGRARLLGVDATAAPMPDSLATTGESGLTITDALIQAGRSAGGALTYARGLRRQIAAWQPDVIHSNGIKAHVLGAWSRRGARLVWHVHDYLSARPLSVRLLRRHARSAAAVIANSQSVAADVSAALGPRVRTTVVYNAIDTERFSPEGPRLDLDAASGLAAPDEPVLRVGLVGTFARWKGHDVFLRAVANLRHRHRLRAYIVGGPVYRTGAASQTSFEELARLAHELGVDGDAGFTGFVEEPADAYRALDVVVHASTSPEPFGLCIAEAMACGRPVVIADAGGAREVGNPGRTCLAHPPGDVAALTSALDQLLSNAVLRRELARRGREHVSTRFTRRAAGMSLRDLYLELVGVAPAGSSTGSDAQRYDFRAPR
ncbi:MAG TPA: glycosyltransferase family 4 protein [Vicinamibacterales bacterium]|nr:glycosyltransferase family 4 protein [Vicinamibacterales bacterium]